MTSASQLRRKNIVIEDVNGGKIVKYRGLEIGYAYVDDDSGHWVFEPCTLRLSVGTLRFGRYKNLTDRLPHIVKSL